MHHCLYLYHQPIMKNHTDQNWENVQSVTLVSLADADLFCEGKFFLMSEVGGLVWVYRKAMVTHRSPLYIHGEQNSISTHLDTQHIKAWGALDSTAEDHVKFHICQARTGNWGCRALITSTVSPDSPERYRVKQCAKSKLCTLTWSFYRYQPVLHYIKVPDRPPSGHRAREHESTAESECGGWKRLTNECSGLWSGGR